METLHARASSINIASPTTPVRDMHHRQQPVVRPMTVVPRLSPSSSRVNLTLSRPTSASGRPVQPLSSATPDGPAGSGLRGMDGPSDPEGGPSICGMPLKYVSLVTLAVQNAALTIVMHYSRVSIPPSHAYSPAAAVLANELLKGTISFLVALMGAASRPYVPPTSRKSISGMAGVSPITWASRIRRVNSEIFSPDCFKLSIPAILYVIQNSLQFVAVSNLPVASYQVTYQMKILTTAAFSVAMLGKRLGSTKWLALLFLALGVGIVQIQTTAANHPPSRLAEMPVGSAAAAAPVHVHIMNPLKGFAAVSAACMTSGLAGVYFEMVLKNSKADLWVRNVQLSLFSIIPALLPIIYSAPTPDSRGLLQDLFKHFGWWAWATVAIQVFGGLVTAVVIKYSDNIMKGFATSLSIILSFLASVVLFDFRITPAFLLGSSTVLAATWMYNQPSLGSTGITTAEDKETPFPGSPINHNGPIIGQFPSAKAKTSPFGSPKSIASVLGLAGPEKIGLNGDFHFGGDSKAYLNTPYGSPYPSRTPSPVPRESKTYLHTPYESPYSSRSASPTPSAAAAPGPHNSRIVHG